MNNRKKGQGGAILLVLLSFVTLIIFLIISSQPVDDPGIDSAWENEFSLTTTTPTRSVVAEEGGWWDEVEAKKPESTMPSMPDISLIEATSTPLAETQRAIVLSPTVTATRTPLFDPNATSTPTKEDK